MARKLRHRYGISLKELAEAAGVSWQLVSLIELEKNRQTPAHEIMLQNASAAIIASRRAQMAALEKELNEYGGKLFEEVSNGV